MSRICASYMKPAIRLAALMELPVKYIWSHDAFRVGEDGPTLESSLTPACRKAPRKFPGLNARLLLRNPSVLAPSGG